MSGIPEFGTLGSIARWGPPLSLEEPLRRIGTKSLLDPANAEMYLVSYLENEHVLEASLGGRVTVEEIAVFGEELVEAIEIFGPCNILLDYSRALSFDRNAILALGVAKDACLRAGAQKIVSVPCTDHDLVRHTSSRIQEVLEGKEEFVLDPQSVHFSAIVVSLPEVA